MTYGVKIYIRIQCFKTAVEDDQGDFSVQQSGQATAHKILRPLRKSLYLECSWNMTVAPIVAPLGCPSE